MPRDARSKHLVVEDLIDLLEDRLAPAARRAAEEHLGRPCRECRERVRVLGALIERMRADRMGEVPAELRARAIALFTASPPAATLEGGARRWLELVFDSLRTPLPAAARRAVGETRRLRFAGGPIAVEVECEAESADQFVLRGRLDAGEPDLHRVEVRIGGERFERWSGERGDFVFEGLPRGEVRLTVRGPGGEFDLPPFNA